MKSKHKFRISLVISLALLTSFFYPFKLLTSVNVLKVVHAEESLFITTENLNLRSSFSSKSKVLLTIPKGKTIKKIGVYGEDKSWFKVSFNSKIGYVSTKYVTPKPIPKNSVSSINTIYKTKTSLNLRKGPSVKSPVLMTIPKSSPLMYHAASGPWYKVSYNGTQGYVASQYVTISPSAMKSRSKQTTEIRSSMSLVNSKVLITIPASTEVTVLGKSGTTGSWLKVMYNGITGFTPARHYIVQVAPGDSLSTYPTYITIENLNLRNQASRYGSILTTIPSGTSISVISKSASWYKVRYNNQVGYVSSGFVQPFTGKTPIKSPVIPANKHVILIDAGHGGGDAGAVTSNGTVQEKVLTLNIANRVADELKKNYELYEVKLTRSNDRYLSLVERTNLSERLDADAFISVHINSSPSFATGHEALVPTSSAYTTNPYANASRRLGEVINQEIAMNVPDFKNRGVKRQDVYVVGRNTVPSTLIEYGFIANSVDRSYMSGSNMIKATAKGIDKFMKSYY